MRRLAIMLCFISRVISGTYTVEHQTYSQQVVRKSRSNLPTVKHGSVYTQFNNKPGIFATVTEPPADSFAVNEPLEFKTADKLRDESPIYEEFIMPHTTPSIVRREVDYELAKSAADSKYDSLRVESDLMHDKMKSLIHYQPQHESFNEPISGYDSSNEFHMDDDDVRTNSRSLYDNWPYFYHTPYEYEHNKDKYDAEKAKDKRYAAEGFGSIIPVHEFIENDTPKVNGYEITPKYFHDIIDNPIVGDEPFFSFVLNDYFEKNSEEDPLVFKGVDWGKDFDHDSYMPELDDIIRKRRLEDNSYYSTVSPAANKEKHTSKKLSQADTAKVKGFKKDNDFDKYAHGAKKNSDHTTGFENKANHYNGFKDFLDSFANKFGAEDHTKNNNYIHQTHADKGEKRKGFHRVYHKDEYQEDKEFYDNNNKSTKAVQKGSSNAHVGGSEALLRSQAQAAVGNESKSLKNSGNKTDKKFENSHKGHDRINKLQNQFDKYIDVAKEAALSNNADYGDHFSK